MVSCEPRACIPASHASSSAVVANLQEHIIRDCPQTVYITIEQVDSRRRKWLEADGWELLPGFGLVLRTMPTNCRIKSKLPDPSSEVAEAGMGGDCYMRKLLKMNGGRDRTRTCDLLRVKRDVHSTLLIVLAV